ncbi:hypothetical protein BKA64DRAFT_757260 [Cadophora sp. MPI-SDFR-AT-0126]|nr:hypothetical protein BKA64DRAFT_757260 [Leotiomycetes sp. MPI-SDFR-AT-0126]
MSSTPQIYSTDTSTDTSLNHHSISSDLPYNQSLRTQRTQRQQATLKHAIQPFPANIEIEHDSLTATRFARAEYSPDPDLHESPRGKRMVLWSNSKIGTAGKSRYGIGVTYMRSRDRWVDLEYQIQREIKDWVAEIAAISKALQIAAEEVSRTERKPAVVVVYTGSRRVLERMKKGIVGVVPDQKFLLKPGILAAERIKDCGVAVELRWGPDTESVQGSRRAMHAARRGANYTPSAGQGDRVLEVQSKTKRARARARARSRPPAIVLPDVEATGLGLLRLELRAR